MMKKHKIDTLLSEKEISEKVAELGAKIDKDYKEAGVEEVILIGLLKGSIVFMGDLARNMKTMMKMDFMKVSSYGNGMESSGIVKILKDIDECIIGKDVLIVEDIIDSGLTLEYVGKYLGNKGAKSVKICTLLDKPYRREAKVDVDYVGFEIENEFVVGYGIDYAEYYRNLPYIGKVTLLEE